MLQLDKKKSVMVLCVIAVSVFLLAYALFTEPPNPPLGPATDNGDHINLLNTAIDNGYYVNVHGTIYNNDTMTDFINKVANKEPASIRTITYTIEGDQIITDFNYNSEYFLVTTDTTHDRYGPRGITNRSFENLVIYEDENPDLYGGRKMTYHIVTDLPEITTEIFTNGFDGEMLKYE